MINSTVSFTLDYTDTSQDFTSIDQVMPSQTVYNAMHIHIVMYTLIGSIGLVDNSFVILVVATSKTMREKV